MTFGPASRLGVSLFEETPPQEWVSGRSNEEIETLISAVYRQVQVMPMSWKANG